MNKYNEIMSNVTVDPEMKSRIMSAVSKAIREQDGGAAVTDLTEIKTDTIPETDIEPDTPEEPVRKKARKIPIAIISSIAAGLLVIMGVVFFFIRYMGVSKSAAETVKAHNEQADQVNSAIDNALGGDGGVVYEATEAMDTEDAGSEELENKDDLSISGDNKNYAIASRDKNVTSGTTKLPGETEDVDYSQGIGNERIDKISRKLPFDLESTGSGKYTDGSLKEVFFGEGGEKVIVVTTYEDTDVMKKVFPSNKSAAVAGTTPGGISVELYYVPFGNVPKLGKGETTDKINAAVFKKNGYKYLVVFSDIVAPEVLYDLIDVV